MPSVLITLTPKEIDYANDVGLRRHRYALRNGAKHKSGIPRDNAVDMFRDQVACRCELAAHIGLGTHYWHDYSETDTGKVADLDYFIDVKGRGTLNHNLLVQFEDPPDYAYVSVFHGRHPQYSIDGWLWGKEIQFPAYIISMPLGTAYGIKPINNSDAKLKTPQQLMEIIKQRLGK